MEFNHAEVKVDPDYEQNYSAIKQVELNKTENERECGEKLKKLIKEEFDKELLVRRKHIESIEEQLFKAQKLLHLVRYALVNQYYNSKSLEMDEDYKEENVVSFDGQNRIHPAVKKLLDNNSTLPILNKSKRKVKNVIPVEVKAEVVDEPVRKKVKLEEEVETPLFVSNKVLPLSSSVRNRRKVKKRIVIGNISKYVPSSENDILVYRWMVYVRGPKETPDVSSFVQRVVFHLHPSYKPNDVITVSKSPFHLARRGWGEFPIRVQIVFKNAKDKPVDIVHKLKLDQKHTGRQVLGNETVVDVFLHEEDLGGDENYLDRLIDEETTERNILEEGHNDHNYSLHHNLEGIQIVKSEGHTGENPDTPLIYGLENYILQENNKIRPNKKSPVKLLTRQIFLNKSLNLKPVEVVATSIDYNEFKLVLPRKFRNMGEVLPYIFKRLPLWTKLADNVNYKCTYPFVCLTYQDYCKSNIGKRLSSEWSRAKTIKKILEGKNIHNSKNWNTKALLMYGRCHLYTPLSSYSIFAHDSREKSLILNCYTTKSNNERFKDCIKEEDVNIDVLSDSKVNSKTTHRLDITDKTLEPQCSFVRQIALNSGVILKPEEVLPSVVWNGAERMLLEAMKSLAENLIRRASCHLVCHKNKKFVENQSELTKDHIQMALKDRREFSAIANFQKRKQELDFFM